MKTALWNSIFGLFFIGIVIAGADYLYQSGLFIPYIPLGDFLLITLATFRLIRLFSYDIITQFIRDFLGKYEKGTFLGTLGALINCPWCAGLWFAFFVTFFYFAHPLAWFLIVILAIAGVASLFQLTANLLGWSAELKKRTVLQSEVKTNSTCG
jgi:hypothetical protein